MAMVGGFQGQLLEITVVGCNKLRDTEWISKQDPYVCLEYASTKFRTRTCTDGGKTPSFNEKFTLNLIEGLREVNVSVWNSNTLSSDDFIGSGKIQLGKVLSQGFDDNAWSLLGKRGKYGGEVRIIMHYANTHHSVPPNHHAVSYHSGGAPAPPYGMPAPPPPYGMTSPYPNQHAPPTSYPQAGYPPPSPYPYPPTPASHGQQSYPPPAAPYSSAPYPQQPYSQPPNLYHSPAPYPGIYPPPPY